MGRCYMPDHCLCVVRLLSPQVGGKWEAANRGSQPMGGEAEGMHPFAKPCPARPQSKLSRLGLGELGLGLGLWPHLKPNETQLSS